jgi:hypothetical protein
MLIEETDDGRDPRDVDHFPVLISPRIRLFSRIVGIFLIDSIPKLNKSNRRMLSKQL